MYNENNFVGKKELDTITRQLPIGKARVENIINPIAETKGGELNTSYVNSETINRINGFKEAVKSEYANMGKSTQEQAEARFAIDLFMSGITGQDFATASANHDENIRAYFGRDLDDKGIIDTWKKGWKSNEYTTDMARISNKMDEIRFWHPEDYEDRQDYIELQSQLAETEEKLFAYGDYSGSKFKQGVNMAGGFLAQNLPLIVMGVGLGMIGGALGAGVAAGSSTMSLGLGATNAGAMGAIGAKLGLTAGTTAGLINGVMAGKVASDWYSFSNVCDLERGLCLYDLKDKDIPNGEKRAIAWLVGAVNGTIEIMTPDVFTGDSVFSKTIFKKIEDFTTDYVSTIAKEALKRGINETVEEILQGSVSNYAMLVADKIEQEYANTDGKKEFYEKGMFSKRYGLTTEELGNILGDSIKENWKVLPVMLATGGMSAIAGTSLVRSVVATENHKASKIQAMPKNAKNRQYFSTEKLHQSVRADVTNADISEALGIPVYDIDNLNTKSDTNDTKSSVGSVKDESQSKKYNILKSTDGKYYVELEDGYKLPTVNIIQNADGTYQTDSTSIAVIEFLHKFGFKSAMGQIVESVYDQTIGIVRDDADVTNIKAGTITTLVNEDLYEDYDAENKTFNVNTVQEAKEAVGKIVESNPSVIKATNKVNDSSFSFTVKEVDADGNVNNVDYIVTSDASKFDEKYAQTRKSVRDYVSKSIGKTFSDKKRKKIVEVTTDSYLALSKATGVPVQDLIDKKVKLNIVTDESLKQVKDEIKKGAFSGLSNEELKANKLGAWVETFVDEATNEKTFKINISSEARVPTVIHEIGHVIRQMTPDEELRAFSEEYGFDVGKTWIGQTEDIKAGRANEERFVEDFIKYWNTDKAPNNQVKSIFDRIKTILKGFLRSDQMSPKLKQAFDDLFSKYSNKKTINYEINRDLNGNPVTAKELRKGMPIKNEDMVRLNDLDQTKNYSTYNDLDDHNYFVNWQDLKWSIEDKNHKFSSFNKDKINDLYVTNKIIALYDENGDRGGAKGTAEVLELLKQIPLYRQKGDLIRFREIVDNLIRLGDAEQIRERVKAISDSKESLMEFADRVLGIIKRTKYKNDKGTYFTISEIYDGSNEFKSSIDLLKGFKQQPNQYFTLLQESFNKSTDRWGQLYAYVQENKYDGEYISYALKTNLESPLKKVDKTKTENSTVKAKESTTAPVKPSGDVKTTEAKTTTTETKTEKEAKPKTKQEEAEADKKGKEAEQRLKDLGILKEDGEVKSKEELKEELIENAAKVVEQVAKETAQEVKQTVQEMNKEEVKQTNDLKAIMEKDKKDNGKKLMAEIDDINEESLNIPTTNDYGYRFIKFGKEGKNFKNVDTFEGVYNKLSDLEDRAESLKKYFHEKGDTKNEEKIEELIFDMDGLVGGFEYIIDNNLNGSTLEDIQKYKKENNLEQGEIQTVNEYANLFIKDTSKVETESNNETVSETGKKINITKIKRDSEVDILNYPSLDINKKGLFGNNEQSDTKNDVTNQIVDEIKQKRTKQKIKIKKEDIIKKNKIKVNGQAKASTTDTTEAEKPAKTGKTFKVETPKETTQQETKETQKEAKKTSTTEKTTEKKPKQVKKEEVLKLSIFSIDTKIPYKGNEQEQIKKKLASDITDKGESFFKELHEIAEEIKKQNDSVAKDEAVQDVMLVSYGKDTGPFAKIKDDRQAKVYLYSTLNRATNIVENRVRFRENNLADLELVRKVVNSIEAIEETGLTTENTQDGTTLFELFFEGTTDQNQAKVSELAQSIINLLNDKNFKIQYFDNLTEDELKLVQNVLLAYSTNIASDIRQYLDMKAQNDQIMSKLKKQLKFNDRTTDANIASSMLFLAQTIYDKKADSRNEFVEIVIQDGGDDKDENVNIYKQYRDSYIKNEGLLSSKRIPMTSQLKEIIASTTEEKNGKMVKKYGVIEQNINSGIKFKDWNIQEKKLMSELISQLKQRGKESLAQKKAIESFELNRTAEKMMGSFATINELLGEKNMFWDFMEEKFNANAGSTYEHLMRIYMGELDKKEGKKSYLDVRDVKIDEINNYIEEHDIILSEDGGYDMLQGLYTDLELIGLLREKYKYDALQYGLQHPNKYFSDTQKKEIEIMGQNIRELGWMMEKPQSVMKLLDAYEHDTRKNGIDYTGEFSKFFLNEAANHRTNEILGIKSRFETASAEFEKIFGTKMDKRYTEVGFSEKVAIPNGKGYVTSQVVTRDDLIGIYIYSKDEESKAYKCLIDDQGNNISEEYVEALRTNKFTEEQLSKWGNDVVLSDKERAWGDFLIKELKSKEGAIAQVFYRLDNKLLDVRPYYFPLFNSLLERKTMSIEKAERETIKNVTERAGRADVEDRFTKEITKKVYPLRLGATSNWQDAVYQEEHYINFEEWVNKANRLLGKESYNMNMATAIEYLAGPKQSKALVDYVNRVAGYYDDMSNISKKLNKFVATVGVSKIIGSLPSSLKNTLSVFTGILNGKTSKSAVAQAMQYFTSGDMAQLQDFIYSNDETMRNRSSEPFIGFFKQAESYTKMQDISKQIADKGLWLMQKIDQNAANFVWLSAYYTALEKNLSNEEAVDYARQVVFATQSSSDTLANASIQESKNPFVKYAMLFTSDLINNWNMLWSDIPTSIRQAKFVNENVFKHYLRYAVPILLGAGSALIGMGWLPEDDDDSEWFDTETFLKDIFNEYVDSSVPYAGTVFTSVWSGFKSKDIGDMIPVLRPFAELTQTTYKYFDDKNDKTKSAKKKTSGVDVVDDFYQLILSSFELVGLPANQINRMTKTVVRKNGKKYEVGLDFGYLYNNALGRYKFFDD